MLDALINSLYSALDRSPNKQAALRVRHPDGFKWLIRRRVLTAQTGAGNVLGTVSLVDYTIQGLAEWLESHDCLVLHVEPAFAALSAGTLLSGSGDELQPNGDILFAYDSILWSIMDAYAIEIEEQQFQVSEAIKELYLKTASGEWLDYWGEHFGLSRGAYANDDDYRNFLIHEAVRVRSNPVALEAAILEITGRSIEIREPWRDLFFLSESRLDNHLTYDGTQVGPHLFQLVSREYSNIKWDDVLPIAQRSRPAGVLMLDPVWLPPVRNLQKEDHGYGLVGKQNHVIRCTYADKPTLDNFLLGESSNTPNYRIQLFDLFAKSALQGIVGPTVGIKPRHNFIRSGIVLSDMEDRIGSEHFRLPMVVRAVTSRGMLGEVVLSDGSEKEKVWGVEFVDFTNVARGNASPPRGTGLIHSQLSVKRAALDRVMRLDEWRFGDPIDLSPQTIKTDHFIKHNRDVVRGAQHGLRSFRTFIRAEVVLSDMTERMGHENFRFAGYVPIAAKPTTTLSDSYLSGGVA